MEKEPILRLETITKRFGKVTANEGVNFDLRPGEIHGLLGENGAGKSTLMNILYGLHQPDGGEIYLSGERIRIHSPHDAIAKGIGMVHQNFMQVQTLSVLDNVILGLPSRGPFLDRASARRKLMNIASRYGLSIDPDAYIWQLSIGDRQRVEILKALYRQVKILILDEPTSVLTPREAEDLFATLRELVGQGLSVIFITHHLEEALTITDRITVLRGGQVVGIVATAATNKHELAALMVGREVLFRLHREDWAGQQSEVLRVEGLSALGDRGHLALQSVSFSVQQGEIVGLAGVDGNGQSELVQTLTGLRTAQAGRFWVDGHELTGATPSTILQNGVGHIPENLEDGLIPEFSLVDNLMLNRHYVAPFARRGVLQKRHMNEQAEGLLAQYDVRAASAEARVRTLSGGNKQKLIVAREVSRSPRLLLAAHPTRGVDIGAEEYIRNLLLQKRQEGMAILLISTKLEEIMSLSDRILVIERGRIRGEMRREEASLEKIGLLMAGSEVTE